MPMLCRTLCRGARYQRGYKNVIGKGVELNKAGTDSQLMMETSGHGALAENHYLDDGAYLAVKSLIELVRLRVAGKAGLGDLLKGLREPLEASEFRIPIQVRGAGFCSWSS